MIAGADAPKHGEAKNSWLTGTAAWTFVNVSQYLLGIQPDYDGLRIDPCLPDELKEIGLNRTYRDAKYHIHITKPDGIEKGVHKMLVNGKEVEGNLLRPLDGCTEYNVEIIMG